MVRLKGFRKLTPVDEALNKFLGAIKIGKLKTASVPLDQALNRVLAEPIEANDDVPRFDRSAVDGYAVRAKDTVCASQFKPGIMILSNENEIEENQAKQVWTGAPIPKGADAVIMLENTKRVEEGIEVWASLALGENVSRRGEDIKKGEIAVDAGVRLKPQHLGLIAALGTARVKVFEKPRIAILTTGNELAEIGSKRQENQIFDANKHVVSALCRELGAEPLDLGIAEDNLEEIVEKLRAGLVADAIITTGGTSVGASDLVPEAVNRIGKPGVLVHGVAMRPAMPTALAVADGKPAVILSGNPVAAMIAFEVFARPLICRMLGLKKEEPRPTLKAIITRRVNTILGRRTFVRVRVHKKDENFLADPMSAKGSGMITTMTRSNGYVVAPENREGLEEGEAVTVHVFGSIEGFGKDVWETNVS